MSNKSKYVIFALKTKKNGPLALRQQNYLLFHDVETHANGEVTYGRARYEPGEVASNIISSRVGG